MEAETQKKASLFVLFLTRSAGEDEISFLPTRSRWKTRILASSTGTVYKLVYYVKSVTLSGPEMMSLILMWEEDGQPVSCGMKTRRREEEVRARLVDR